MEARIARLESDVSHLRSDVGEMKLDLRGIRDKIDQQLERLRTQWDSKAAELVSSIDRRFDKTDSKIEALRSEIASVKDSLDAAKVWALTLYFALAAVMLGTMARGFGGL